MLESSYEKGSTTIKFFLIFLSFLGIVTLTYGFYSVLSSPFIKIKTSRNKAIFDSMAVSNKEKATKKLYTNYDSIIKVTHNLNEAYYQLAKNNNFLSAQNEHLTYAYDSIFRYNQALIEDFSTYMYSDAHKHPEKYSEQIHQVFAYRRFNVDLGYSYLNKRNKYDLEIENIILRHKYDSILIINNKFKNLNILQQLQKIDSLDNLFIDTLKPVHFKYPYPLELEDRIKALEKQLDSCSKSH